MHLLLVGAGVLLVIMIVVHMIFRVIKFTIIVFLLGVALVSVVYFFQEYLGIDLIGIIAPHL